MDETIDFHEVEKGNWCWVRTDANGAPISAVQGYKNKRAAQNGAKDHNPDFYAKPADVRQIMGDVE